MISGGASYEGLRDGTETYWHTVAPPDESVLAAYGPGGIGLFTFGLLDTHFSNRGRHGRFVRLLMDTSSLPLGFNRGFGMDENTALVVTGDWSNRIGTAIGERGVLVFDASLAYLDDTNNILGVSCSRLSDGDVISLSTLEISPASFKVRMEFEDNGSEPLTSDDIFREGAFEFDKITRSLLESNSTSTYGKTLQRNPQFKVSVSKEWGKKGSKPAVGFGGVNPNTNAYAFSYIGMKMDIIMV